MAQRIQQTATTTTTNIAGRRRDRIKQQQKTECPQKSVSRWNADCSYLEWELGRLGIPSSFFSLNVFCSFLTEVETGNDSYIYVAYMLGIYVIYWIVIMNSLRQRQRSAMLFRFN